LSGAQGIRTIDTDYVRPHLAASHLLVDSGRAAFIDTGTSLAAPRLVEALAAAGLDGSAVDCILLTHVHLDHAGGAGRLAQLLPHARVYVHPRGAAHLRDPSKLIAGTIAVYGERTYRDLYGTVEPVPAERIVTVADGDELALGARVLRFLHTPGHALHHVCIHDADARVLFSGDTFGVSYREFDAVCGEFAFITTTPTQFDPKQLHASVDRILALRPHTVYLTHYGPVHEIERLAADLHADIDAFVAIARAAAAGPDRVRRMAERIFRHLCHRLAGRGCDADERRLHAMLDMDCELNAAGLESWLVRTAS
jgi:glyoxylase-like metal-dependent hydrolase (beta-lactamase superfamily II)